MWTLENTHTSYLIAGAAGDLRHRIIDVLLRIRPAGEIRAGVRGGSAGKHGNRGRGWIANGVTVVDMDLDDLLSLKHACAGDRRTIAQIATDYAAATGKELHQVRKGSIADGYAELRRMAKAGVHPMAMLPLQYLRPMMPGEGTLRDIANDQYPTVRPTSLLDFMKRHYITRGSKR